MPSSWSEAIRPPEQRTIRVSDGVSLRIFEFTAPDAVPDKPPIVFLPGWISSIEGWRSVLEVLAREHRIVYVETREKRSADLPDGGDVDFSMDRLSMDLHEVLREAVPPAEPFCLMGSSLGSTVILDYLSRRLRQPVLAILVAPNLIFRLPRWVVTAAKRLPASTYTVMKPILKWYLCTFLLDAEKEPEQAERYRRNLDAAEPRRLRANALELDDYSAWDRLPRITAPVLVVAGESDSLHHMEDIERLASMLPEARLEIMASNRETHSARLGHLALQEIDRARRRPPEERGGSRGWR